MTTIPLETYHEVWLALRCGWQVLCELPSVPTTVVLGVKQDGRVLTDFGYKQPLRVWTARQKVVERQGQLW